MREQAQVAGHRYGLYSKRHPNLVKTLQIVQYVDYHSGLYGGNAARCRLLQFPETFCLSEELVAKAMGIPIFNAIGKLGITALQATSLKI